MLLIDWVIHQFHVMQGVARMPVGQNVTQGTTDQVRELIESLASGPSSTQGRWNRKIEKMTGNPVTTSA